MSVEIKYRNILVNSGGQPIPLFSETDQFVRYGNRWNDNRQVTLQGSITGCDYQSLISAKNTLHEIFSKDFQPLEIKNNGETVYYSECNRIEDIDISSNRYFGIVNYNVTLACYPRELTSGVYGVLDPVNRWDFNERDNKILEATHTISARGFNTSTGYNNGFDNAKNYVLSLTGSTTFNPYFISYCTGSSLCIDEYQEQIDRFNNTYSIVERYTIDLHSAGAGYIRYTTDYECDVNNSNSRITLRGEVKSCKNGDLSTLRNKFNSFNPFSAAVAAYFDACGRTDLNSNYLSFGLNENPFSKTISFNYLYDNNFLPRTYFDYTAKIDVNDADITQVTIQGTIRSRGDLNTRWQLVEDYFENQLNLFNIANTEYNLFYNNSPEYPLNPKQLSYSVTKNRFAGEISVEASYDNKELLPEGLDSLEYTLNFAPAVNQIRANPLVNIPGTSCSSQYYVVFLGFKNRVKFSINGRGVGNCIITPENTLSIIKNLANSKLNLYCPTDRIFIERNNIIKTNNYKEKDYSFTFEWSANSANVVNPSPYNFVESLLLK